MTMSEKITTSKKVSKSHTINFYIQHEVKDFYLDVLRHVSENNVSIYIRSLINRDLKRLGFLNKDNKPNERALEDAIAYEEKELALIISKKQKVASALEKQKKRAQAKRKAAVKGRKTRTNQDKKKALITATRERLRQAKEKKKA
jgi:hypothetical protein